MLRHIRVPSVRSVLRIEPCVLCLPRATETEDAVLSVMSLEKVGRELFSSFNRFRRFLFPKENAIRDGGGLEIF